MRPVAAPLLLAALTLGCKGGGDDTGVTSWVVPEQDLGPRLADGTGKADLAYGDVAWFAAEQVVPVLEWRQPGAEIPLVLWRQVQRPTVADDGQCPTRQVAGDTTTWKTYDCRSSQGYEWTGEVSERTWTEEGWSYRRYEFDLTVEGDTEDVAFDRIALQGALVYVDGDGDTLVEAVQVNVAASADGLLSRADVDDPREPVWHDWRVTARYETLPGDVHQMQGDAVLGTIGSLDFSASALKAVPGCAVAPQGTLRVTGQQSAELAFRGEDDCRACAAYTVDGAESGEACSQGT
jgi:hypothetical protein